MLSEIENLKFICQKLNQANILYMLTGSFAGNFYAVPRMTRDIDIVIELYTSQINKLIGLFQSEFYIDKDTISEAINKQSMFNIIHNESFLKIDFIIRKDLVYRDIEFQRRRQIKIEDTQIWIVSPEDLIISKLYWAKDSYSEMQLKDIRNLFFSIQDLDKEYIRKWVCELGIEEIYERVK